MNQALLIALASRIVERPNKQRKGPAALVLEMDTALLLGS